LHSLQQVLHPKGVENHHFFKSYDFLWSTKCTSSASIIYRYKNVKYITIKP